MESTPGPIIAMTDAIGTFLDELVTIIDEGETTPQAAPGGVRREEREQLLTTDRPDLDQLLGGGLVPGGMLVVEATDLRLANAMALSIATHLQTPADFFVLDSRTAIRHLLASMTSIPEGSLISGALSERAWSRLSHAVTMLVAFPRFVVERLHPDQRTMPSPVAVVLDGDRFVARPSGIRRMYHHAERSSVTVVMAAVAGRGLGPLVTPGLRVVSLRTSPEGMVTAQLLDDEEWPVAEATMTVGYDALSSRIMLDDEESWLI